MTTRELVSETATHRRYRVTNDAGQHIGYDDESVPTAQQVNADALRDKAKQSLATNNAYLKLATPTAAETATQIKRLTRQSSTLIRMLLDGLDDTDGT
jgi:hypothetical protein